MFNSVAFRCSALVNFHYIWQKLCWFTKLKKSFLFANFSITWTSWIMNVSFRENLNWLVGFWWINEKVSSKIKSSNRGYRSRCNIFSTFLFSTFYDLMIKLPWQFSSKLELFSNAGGPIISTALSRRERWRNGFIGWWKHRFKQQTS